MVGDAIHEIRGLSPYGDLGGTWTLRRGVILHNIAQKSKTRTIDKNEICFRTIIIRKGTSGDPEPHGDFERPCRHRGASNIAKKMAQKT